MHLVLRPAGQATYDTIWLENGFLRNDDRYAVIDLEVRFSWWALDAGTSNAENKFH